jgi:hypothetical protein
MGFREYGESDARSAGYPRARIEGLSDGCDPAMRLLLNLIPISLMPLGVRFTDGRAF